MEKFIRVIVEYNKAYKKTLDMIFMGKGVFVTGAGGFLGKDLLERLMQESDKPFGFLARTRETYDVLAKRFYDSNPGRVEMFRGDITERNLGLSQEETEFIHENYDEYWHLAASTDFDRTKRTEIERTNVLGTRNFIEFLKSVDISRFFYMSTAYVCGKEHGIIPEERLKMPEKNEDPDFGFKNPYERTKRQCELEVMGSGIPFTIIRPSIIIGDSRTGDAKGEDRMYYGYLLSLYRAVLHMFGNKDSFIEHWKSNGHVFPDVDTRLFGSGETTKNIVTLDDVVNVCAAIRKQEYQRPLNFYNVVNPVNLTMQSTTDAIQKALKIQGFRFDPNLDSRDKLSGNVVERAAYRFTPQFWPYFQVAEPQWQYDNVRSLGIKRVVMNNNLFSFMMNSYVKKELMNGV